jgi:nucleotide-binding universal stress UspA family protein
MLSRILLPLDPSPYSDSAFKYAVGLAKAHDAEITGLMILDAPEIERTIGPVTPGAVEYARKAERRREALAHEHIQKGLAAFATACEASGVRHGEVEVQGAPAEMIIGESVFFDVVLMGIETHFNFETSDEPAHTLEAIAGRMMPPVITVPLKEYSPDATKRVTIGFGGSTTAARSIRQFVALGLFKNAEITVLCSNPDIEVANELMGAVSRYLSAHGYDQIEHAWTPGPVIEAMREQYLEDADLIVLGSHAKHGILSFLYGHVTKFVLNEASTPVFIAN